MLGSGSVTGAGVFCVDAEGIIVMEHDFTFWREETISSVKRKPVATTTAKAVAERTGGLLPVTFIGFHRATGDGFREVVASHVDKVLSLLRR